MAAEALHLYQSDVPDTRSSTSNVNSDSASSSRMVKDLLSELSDSPAKKKKKQETGGEGGGVDQALAAAAAPSFLASAHAAAQDSTEAAVKRTLGEITSLVMTSLEPIEIKLSNADAARVANSNGGLLGLEEKSDDGGSSVPSAAVRRRPMLETMLRIRRTLPLPPPRRDMVGVAVVALLLRPVRLC